MNIAYAHSPYPNPEILGFVQGDALSLGFFIIAFILGALHAFEPGHGKAVGAAYLVGSGGSVLNAVVYGAVTTATHVGMVFLLGFIVLFGSSFFMPNISSTLQLISGIIIIITGLWMFRRGEHHHKKAGILSLALSAGIIPCPTAIAILLTAVYFNKLLLGLMLLIVFSAGIGLTLTAVGIASTKSSGIIFKRLEKYHHTIPKVSGLIVAILGVILTVSVLPSFVANP